MDTMLKTMLKKATTSQSKDTSEMLQQIQESGLSRSDEIEINNLEHDRALWRHRTPPDVANVLAKIQESDQLIGKLELKLQLFLEQVLYILSTL